MFVNMRKPRLWTIGILVFSCLNLCDGTPLNLLSSGLLKNNNQTFDFKFPDPEATMTMEEVVAFHGYPLEEYTVLSEDGYYTTIQRIPHGKNNSDVTNRQPVLIMHGLGGLASIWVVNIPDQNLAYILADAGYDVWMGNSRGSAYSLKHKTLSPKKREFWEFSWQQMAYYDMPAIIDFILNKTQQSKLHYIGHSMGTTIPFAMLSIRPEYNDKMFGVYTLAPVAYLEHATDPIVYLAGQEELIDWIFNTLNVYEFKFNNILYQVLALELCGKPRETKICEFILKELEREDFARLNLSRADVFLHLTPSSFSVQTVAHYAQIIKFNKFQEYDYGKDQNEIIYGQPTPPEYNLTQITAPVALFYGKADRLADPDDVATLKSILPNVVLDYLVPDPEWAHLDFMWGLTVKTLVYEPLMKLMKQLAPNEM